MSFWGKLFGHKVAEVSTDKAIRRGQAAERLLNDETVKEALEDAEIQILQEFRSSRIDKPEELVKLKMALQALHGVQVRLKAYVGDAQILMEEQTRREKAAEFEKRRGYKPA